MPTRYKSTLDRDDGTKLGRMVVGAASLSLRKGFDQPATCVARIDDVVDTEPLGGAQGADAGPRFVDHLLPPLLGIGCAFVFLPKGDVDCTLDRHRANFRSRPGEAGICGKAAAATHCEV